MADSFQADSFEEETPARSKDLMGRIKERLVPNIPTRAGRAVGEFVIPGSNIGAATTAASFLPGGLPVRLGASLLAGGVLGGPAGMGEAALQTGVGEAAGYPIRQVSRVVLSKMDPLIRNLAGAIKDAVPSFAGKTPQETIANAIGQRGQDIISKKYGEALENIIGKKRLADIKGAGIDDPVQYLRNIGEFTPQQESLLAAANRWYQPAKSVQDLMAGTRPKEGGLDVPQLQKNYLEKGVSVPNPRAFEAAIRRGETNPLLADQPGSFPIRWHFGFIPTAYGLPRGPQLIGAPERQSALMANIARSLGVRGVGSLTERE